MKRRPKIIQALMEDRPLTRGELVLLAVCAVPVVVQGAAKEWKDAKR